ncbi:MAG: phage holin family protein [Methanobrevibacter sp.]|jgi:hypothetical protein|nr:phage holin family protein [Candidatus Methanovirga aequatorialis]
MSKFKILSGLFIICLMLCTQPLSFAAKPNQDDIKNEILDDAIDLDTNQFMDEVSNITGNDTLKDNYTDSLPGKEHDYYQGLGAGEISLAELVHINELINERVASEYGYKGGKLYLGYIEHPDDLVTDDSTFKGMTYNDVFTKVDWYKKLKSNLDNYVLTFSHMSRDERIDYLNVKKPDTDNTKEIFETATTEQIINILPKCNNSISNLANVAEKYSAHGVNTDGIGEINGAIDKFNDDVNHYNNEYLLYPDSRSFNISDYDNLSGQSLTMLNESYNKLNETTHNIVVSGSAFTGLSIALIAVGGICFLYGIGISCSPGWIGGIPLIVVGIIMILLGAILASVGGSILGLMVPALDSVLSKIRDTMDKLQKNNNSVNKATF